MCEANAMLTYNEAPQRQSGRRGPGSGFGTVNVPGTKVGAVVSIGLVVISWFALPLARPFILGTGGLGLLLGLFLYWKHRGPE
jgi:hypothetical protein